MVKARYGKSKKAKKNYKISNKFKRRGNKNRSTKQISKVKATILARELNVKLPWVDSGSLSTASGGSTYAAYLGNSLIGEPSSYVSATPTAGDKWANGVVEYSSFYDNYRVMASSIHIRVLLYGNNNLTQCVLVPVTAQNNGVATIAARITELNTLTFEDLSALPYAKQRIINNVGFNNFVNFKMFRTTKQMLGIKDIKDNQEVINRMPELDGLGGTIIVNPQHAYFYFFKMFNTGTAATTQTSYVTTRITYYTNLLGRESTAMAIVPSE